MYEIGIQKMILIFHQSTGILDIKKVNLLVIYILENEFWSMRIDENFFGNNFVFLYWSYMDLQELVSI